MELFGSGSADKLCLSAPSGAMNAPALSLKQNSSTLVLLKILASGSRSRVVLSILLIYELSLLCPSLFWTSEQKAYG